MWHIISTLFVHFVFFILILSDENSFKFLCLCNIQQYVIHFEGFLDPTSRLLRELWISYSYYFIHILALFREAAKNTCRGGVPQLTYPLVLVIR